VQWTKDTVHTYYIPDSLAYLPEYKKQVYMVAASGITHWLLLLGGGYSDQSD